MKVYQGHSASPGLVMGQVSRLERKQESFSAGPFDPAREQRLLEGAVHTAQQELDSMAERSGPTEQAIFLFQSMMLEDEGFMNEVRFQIKAGIGAAEAMDRVGHRYADQLAHMEDNAYMQLRSVDILDAARRVVNILTNRPRVWLALDHPVILAADVLMPSDLFSVPAGMILGIITSEGNKQSHAAIIARAMHIPGVVQVGEDFLDDCDGRTVVLDAGNGQEDIETALQSGASGVGLLRSGYLMLPGRPVDEQEQFVFYQSCIAAAKGGVVTVRTFDFGADRTVADAHQGPESSKLGLRGIRSSLRRPHQFETQICALLRAAAHGPLRIMFPMVTNLEDWDEAMMLVERCRQHLRERGEEFNENTPFGVMLGVPSACLTAEEFAAHGCSFFVIATNDLTQYTHAVDRDLSIAERYYRPASHAMKKLIRMVLDAADAAHIPVTICGMAVGNPANTLQYLQLGLRSFSMSPQSLIQVKKTLMEAKVE